MAQRVPMVAEYNTVNQRLMTTVLAKMGRVADIVANVREAVAALARADYDLVLMDCSMPEMDGIRGDGPHPAQ